MNSPNNGGPAFPAHPSALGDHDGMSLRDYFAAKAMQAALTNAKLPGLLDREVETLAALDKLAGAMYVIADAMLKARATT